MVWPNTTCMILRILRTMTQTITMPSSLLLRNNRYSTTRRLMTTRNSTPVRTYSSHHAHRNQHHHHQHHHHYQSHYNNHHANPVLFAVAATAFVASLGVVRKPIVTVADAQQTTASTIRPASSTTSGDDHPSKQSKTTSSQGATVRSSHNKRQNCPFYGCPLLPLDIVATAYNSESTSQSTREKMVAYNYVRQKTQEDLQKEQQQQANDSSSPSSETTNNSTGWWVEPIETMWAIDDGLATMTMTGYKGGPLYEQINQDRSFVVGPYRIHNENDNNHNSEEEERVLLGVFDGHARNGELVSGYVNTELPKVLANNLQKAYSSSSSIYATYDNDGLIDITKEVLVDTFIELDQTAPTDDSGGCTATVIFRQGPKVYIANTGDSRSFLVIYRKHSKRTQIVYISQEHKPHLPEERRRIENVGGMVYMPPRGGTSRVIYYDPITRSRSGLAMSRSIGDVTYKTVGVIPDPTVDVVDIPELVQAQLSSSQDENDDDDVHIFAVAASDGMMDYTHANTIAMVLAESLFEETGPHLLRACEVLVETAANGWHKAKRGRYRDDIALAVASLRVPPSSSKQSKDSPQKRDEL